MRAPSGLEQSVFHSKAGAKDSDVLRESLLDLRTENRDSQLQCKTSDFSLPSLPVEEEALLRHLLPCTVHFAVVVRRPTPM